MPLTPPCRPHTTKHPATGPMAAFGWRLDEGPLQWGRYEPGQGGNTAAISLRLFVWGPLVNPLAVRQAFSLTSANAEHLPAIPSGFRPDLRSVRPKA
jgi:hypothetical protein